MNTHYLIWIVAGLCIVAGTLFLSFQKGGVIAMFLGAGSIPQTSSTIPPPPPPPLPALMPSAPPGTFTFSMGETVEYDGLTLTVLSVESDSRCPIDVQCIQAGSATVALSVTQGGVTQEYILSSDDSLAVGEQRIKIIEVEPAPHSLRTIDPEEYTVTLVVEEVE